MSPQMLITMLPMSVYLFNCIFTAWLWSLHQWLHWIDVTFCHQSLLVLSFLLQWFIYPLLVFVWVDHVINWLSANLLWHNACHFLYYYITIVHWSHHSCFTLALFTSAALPLVHFILQIYSSRSIITAGYWFDRVERLVPHYSVKIRCVRGRNVDRYCQKPIAQLLSLKYIHCTTPISISENITSASELGSHTLTLSSFKQII